jgi:hypothetical protein
MSKCNCNASTGICGCITRGTGRLSFDGYWELPCPHGNDMTIYKEQDYEHSLEDSGAQK